MLSDWRLDVGILHRHILDIRLKHRPLGSSDLHNRKALSSNRRQLNVHSWFSQSHAPCLCKRGR